MITGKRSAVLWQVLSGVYDRLGFDVLGDDAFRRLVSARIIEPASEAGSLRVLDGIGVGQASLRTMFRSLQRAGSGDCRGQIATACSGRASTDGDVSLCLYDVTTLCFEAENEDEPGKVGFSEERRVDPQIVVGLLVDRAGFPLEIGCHERDKAETTTIIAIIKQFQERRSPVDMVVVADAGMLSASNLKELHAAGLRFIVGSRVTKAPADLASHFRWHGDAFTDGQLIDTITPRVATATARGVDDEKMRVEPVWAPAVHERSWRAVWAYSRKRAVRDGHTPTLQENRAKAVVAGDKAARTPRFVTTENGTQTLDETSPARARRLVGLKGYVSNIPADLMPAAEILAGHHDLWQVEAHLTIVFAALAIARSLQNATGLSIKKIVRTLRPLQQIRIRIAGHEHLAEDPLTPAANSILDALNLDPH